MRRLATILIYALLSMVSAQAEEGFSRVGMFALPEDAPDTIILAEDITIAATADLFRALRQRPDATKLILISGGGSVYGALSIAYQVRERGMTTIVPEDGWCYSACAYVYFAGVVRELHGELGVHQISTEGEASLQGAQMTIADILDALEVFGVDPGVLSVMFRTAPDDLHIFSRQEIEDLNLEASPQERVAEVPAATSTTAAPTEPVLRREPAPAPVDPQPAAAPQEAPVRRASIEPSTVPVISPNDDGPVPPGVPENVTVDPRNAMREDGRQERVLTITEPRPWLRPCAA